MTAPPDAASPPIIPGIVAQHADEAAFLWGMRDPLVHAPHVSLDDLARHDERMEAHLDGLRIAGDPGWAMCAEAMAAGDPGAVFVACVLAFESGRVDRLRDALTVARADAALARAASSALGWISPTQAARIAERLTRAEDPALRRIGIGGLALHRYDPGIALGQALVSDDPALLARALRAAGELGRRDTLPLLQGHGAAEQVEVRVWAAWSAALLAGESGALRALAEFVEMPVSPAAAPVPSDAPADAPAEDDTAWADWLAEHGDPPTSEDASATTKPAPWSDAHERLRQCALQLVVRRLSPPAALAWVQRLATRPALQRDATIAAGALGDPVVVPWLIDRMREPALARVAGEAFATTTGVDLRAAELVDVARKGTRTGPTEVPEDEEVAVDSDEHLQWPDAARVSAWWAARAHAFTAGERYLFGRPYEPAWLAHVLRHGMQRQRAAAALELAIRRPGSALVEVRAPAGRQLAALGQPDAPP